MAFRTNKVPAIEERTVSGSSVSFNSAFALPLKACKVSFSATQAGSGYPSPSNPRAISGVSAIGLNANSTPVSVSLGDTRYGGELDVLTGKLTITHKAVDLGNYLYDRSMATGGYYFFYTLLEDRAVLGDGNLCEIFDYKGASANVLTGDWQFSRSSTNTRFFFRTDTITDSNDFRNAVSGYKIYYPLATPQIIQLSANELSSIIGNNTFSTDTGTLEITFADLQEKSASGSVATFNTALAMPLSSCNIAVNAWQEGSGDPSPVNNRPIHGFDKANVIRSGKTYQREGSKIVIEATQEGSGVPSPSNVRPIHAGLTIVRDDDSVLDVYGGTLNAVSGELTVTWGYKVFDGTESWGIEPPYNFYAKSGRGQGSVLVTSYSLICSHAPSVTTNWAGDYLNCYISQTGNFNIQIPTEEWGIPHTEADMNSWVSLQYANGTPLTIIYRLDIPEVIQLSATELQRAKEALGIDTYLIQLGQEVYGAEVDFVNGVAHIDTGLLIFDGTEDWGEYGSAGFQSGVYSSLKLGNRQEGMANWLITTGTVNQFGLIISLNNKKFYATHIKENISEVIDVTSWKQYLEAHPLQVVYPLAEPFDIQLTPTQIETIIGNNTIFADTGDVDLTYKDLDIAKRGNFREVFKLPS